MRPSSGACGWLDVRGRCSLARTCDATSGASSSDVSLFMGVTAPTWTRQSRAWHATLGTRTPLRLARLKGGRAAKPEGQRPGFAAPVPGNPRVAQVQVDMRSESHCFGRAPGHVLTAAYSSGASCAEAVGSQSALAREHLSRREHLSASLARLPCGTSGENAGQGRPLLARWEPQDSGVCIHVTREKP